MAKHPTAQSNSDAISSSVDAATALRDTVITLRANTENNARELAQTSEKLAGLEHSIVDLSKRNDDQFSAQNRAISELGLSLTGLKNLLQGRNGTVSFSIVLSIIGIAGPLITVASAFGFFVLQAEMAPMTFRQDLFMQLLEKQDVKLEQLNDSGTTSQQIATARFEQQHADDADKFEQKHADDAAAILLLRTQITEHEQAIDMLEKEVAVNAATSTQNQEDQRWEKIKADLSQLLAVAVDRMKIK